MISAVIPARDEPYLQQTIDSLLNNAEGEIEVIAVLDGYWPEQPIKDDPRVVLIHNAEPQGMRSSINAAARIARGKYLMKCDAHCCFDRGFDVKLKKDCQPSWTIVPRRYGLDVETWNRNGRLYEFQYIEKGTLKGRNWPEYADRVKGQQLVDLMTSQGSCWFMYLQRFWDIGGLDEDNHGGMGREAQEVCLKTWLSGGRYVLNRNTWYGHWSKPKEHVISDRAGKKKSVDYAVDLWTNDRWPLARKKLSWLIDKFAPVPSWDDTELKMLEYLKRFKADLTKKSPIIVPGFKRRHLAYMFGVLGFKTGAEVGVANGKYSEMLCNLNPGVKLLSVDPWSSYSEDPRRGRKHEQAYREATERLTPYNATLIRKKSMDGVKDIPKGSLDFVYIDGNHTFDYVMQDIIEWSKRIRPGGIVSGHDYYKFRNAGIIEAVDTYTKVHKIKQWFLCDERTPSFFWVKK